jgi:hypothetical protein
LAHALDQIRKSKAHNCLQIAAPLRCARWGQKQTLSSEYSMTWVLMMSIRFQQPQVYMVSKASLAQERRGFELRTVVGAAPI